MHFRGIALLFHIDNTIWDHGGGRSRLVSSQEVYFELSTSGQNLSWNVTGYSKLFKPLSPKFFCLSNAPSFTMCLFVLQES